MNLYNIKKYILHKNNVNFYFIIFYIDFTIGYYGNEKIDLKKDLNINTIIKDVIF